ncbi:MAG: AAA family ATPase [Oscillochloridaceae bacterium umkhey_bin13]
MHLRSLGSILGGLTAGPVGSLVGGIAGGLVGAAAESLIPGSSGVISNALGASGAEALQSLGQRVRDTLPADDRRRINHDLQRAFRAASIEALHDIGGPQGFPEAWRGGRDVPAAVVFSLTPYDQELVPILVNCLVQLRRAIEDERLLPLAPPHDLAEASVYTYVEQTTLATLSSDATAEQQSLVQLAASFFDGAIAPWLDDQFAPLMVAANDPQDRRQAEELAAGQALRFHLRAHLLERTLVQLNEQLKSPQHTEAWRAFNRLLLEQLRTELARVSAGQQALATGQQEISQRLDILLSQADAKALGQFAGGMADLVAAVGQAQQQTGERLDSLLVRVSAQGDNLLVLLAQNNEIIALVKNSALDISEVRQQVEQLLDAFAAVRPGLERVAWVIPTRFQDDAHCPYPGLAVFAEQQAGLFYGREEEINAFLARPPRPITAITGPSGVGKSSFVQAGLLPQLRQRGGAGLRTLVYRVSTSGELLSDLAAFCAQQGGADPQALLQSLSQRDDALRQILATQRPAPDGYVLLVLDQFEELFVGDNPARASDRRRLLDNLLQLESQPESWLSVILTSRENFFEHPDYLARERLREIVQAENVRLGGLGDRQLRAAITRPLETFAAQHGLALRFEAGVVDLLLADFRKTERTLPLVQYLLRLLWTEQHELSNAAYNRLGGLERALDRHASAIYERFGEGEQRQVNAVLLALVRPGIAGEYTRRRVRRDVLLSQGAGRDDLAGVVRQLANPNSRLISEQQIGEVAYLELTHEILLRQWERLRLLIDMYKTRLQQREALLPNAEQWAQSRARGGRGDSAYLYRGNQLRQARAYVETKDLPEQVDPGIRACYQDSVQQRRRSLIFSGATTLAVLLVIGLVIQFFNQQSVVAQQAARTAAAQQATAEQIANQRATTEAQAVQTAEAEATQRAAAEAGQDREARVARGRSLAAAANTARNSAQYTRAALLALEAVNLALSANETVPVESEQALRDALHELGGRPLYGHSFFIVGLAFSPDGRTLATRAADGTARVWDLATLETMQVLESHLDDYRGNPLETHGLIFVPTQNALVTVSGDNTIRVWDMTAANPDLSLRILPAQDGDEVGVPAIVLHPDGRTLISTHNGRTVRLWDLAAPVPSATVRTLQATGLPEPPEQSLDYGFGAAPIALSQDGRRLVTATGDGFILAWDLSSSDPNSTVRTFAIEQVTGLPMQADMIALSPDGRTLAAASGERAVLIWDLAAPDPAATQRTLQGHTDIVRALAFSPDGRLLATGSNDATARLWDLTIPDPSPTARILAGHTYTVRWLTFSPDGRYLATAGEDGGTATIDDGTVRLWELPGPAQYAAPMLSWPAIHSRVFRGVAPFAFSPDGRTLATSTNDDSVRLWNLAEPETAAMEHLLRGQGLGVATGPFLFDPDGHTLIACTDGTTGFWDLDDPDPNGTMQTPLGAECPLVRSADGRLLITQDSDHVLRIWDLASRSFQTPLQSLAGHTRDVTMLLLSPDNRTLISTGWDATVRVWDLTARDPAATVRILSGFENMVDGWVLLDDGRTLITTNSGTVDQGATGATSRIWDLQAADPNTIVRVVKDQTDEPLMTVLSPDGRYYATTSEAIVGLQPSGDVRIWDLTIANPTAAAQVLRAGAQGLSFSPDSRTLITAGFDGTFQIWDLTAPDPRATVRTVQNQIGMRAQAVSPDGHLMVISILDGIDSPPSLNLVDIDVPDPNTTVRVLRTFENLWSFAFSPDGHRLVSGGGDSRTVQVWALDVRDLIAPACRTIGRNLTPDEWQQYFGDEPYRKTCPEQPGADSLPGSSAMVPADPTPIVALSATPTVIPAAPSPPSLPAAERIGQVELKPRQYASASGEIADLALAPDGETFAIAGSDGTVQLRRIGDGEVIQTLVGHTTPVYRMTFSPDGQLLATDAGEGAVLLWRVADGERVGRIERAGGALAFAPDGQTLATVEDDYKVRLWQVRDGTPLRTLEGDVIDGSRVVFAPDGQALAVATPDDGVLIWRVSDGALLQRILTRTQGWQSIAFSPDSQVLAVCERIGTVGLYQVSDGALVQTLDQEYPAALSVAFAPDRALIATATTELEQAEVKLWRASDGEVVGNLLLGPEVYGGIEVQFTPDGRLLIIAGWQTEAAQIWEYPPAP